MKFKSIKELEAETEKSIQEHGYDRHGNFNKIEALKQVVGLIDRAIKAYPKDKWILLVIKSKIQGK